MGIVSAMTYECIVEHVLVGDGSNGLFSVQKDKISAMVGQGVVGDTHCGVRRLADVRERDLLKFGLPKGIEIENGRMFSAVSCSEKAEIAEALGIQGIIAGELGENLVISGIKDFSALPPGTKIYFKSANGREIRTAVLMIWGPNVPCQLIADALAGQFRGDDMAVFQRVSRDFVSVAMGRRGVVGSVFCSGFIKRGDRAIVYVPAQQLYQPKKESSDG